MRDSLAYASRDDLFACKDASLLPVRILGSPLVVDGQVKGAVVSFEDITALKHAERRSTAQYSVTRALAQSDSVEEAAAKIIESICFNIGWDVGAMWIYDEAAKRLRFVQVWHQAGAVWDHHENLEVQHRKLAKECDQAIGALLKDLKQRGMLDETLVVWRGEFGRTPTVELVMGLPNNRLGKGRDHNHHGFTVWMAGGGVKGGYVHGATDEFGFRAIENKVHVHDLHATILHLLGFDHTQLTFRHAGRDFRLTDVHGGVVHELIA